MRRPLALRIERLFGVGYGFKSSWGVTEGTFEALTLGTLAVIVAIGLIGYAFAGNVRAQEAGIPLEVDLEAAPA